MNCGLRIAGCGLLALGLLLAAEPAASGAQEPASGRTTAARPKDARRASAQLELLSQACAAQCHSLKPIVLQKRDAQAWRRNILLMVSRGAQVLPDEIDPLAAQLASASAGATAPAGAGAAGALPGGRGREILVRTCLSACHTRESLTEARNSREGWNDVVARMKRSGVSIAADDQVVLVEYLATHVGAKP